MKFASAQIPTARQVAKGALIVGVMALQLACEGDFEKQEAPGQSGELGVSELSVIAVSSGAAQVDCSGDDATISYEIRNADADILICIESVVNVPVGAFGYGESELCAEAGRFVRPDSVWDYNSETRTWSRDLIRLKNQMAVLPGRYRLHAKDRNETGAVSDEVVVARPGRADCISSEVGPAPPAATPVPLPTPTPAPAPAPVPPPSAGSGAQGVPVDGFDPALDRGFLAGTWQPRGTKSFWVVDQSGPGAVGGLTAFPGCVNQVPFSWACPPSSGGITMAMGNMISIRYQPGVIPPGGIYLSLTSGPGSGIPAPVRISLSRRPGDFSGQTPSACQTTGLAGSNPRILIRAGYCELKPGEVVYLNVQSTGTCSGGTCRFNVIEPAGLTK